MAKTDNRPKEKMQLTIEFADNGIILRNPELEDDVTLALIGLDEGGYNVIHDEEYKAIGKKIRLADGGGGVRTLRDVDKHRRRN